MYDIIGDIHGCYDELLKLIHQLGYKQENNKFYHPDNRRLVFVGDLTDRGPKSTQVMQFVIDHVRQNEALYVPGNHCDKLYRFLLGRPVQIKHGLETTVAELDNLPFDEARSLEKRFKHMVEQASYYVMLDGGKLIVTHAGIRQDLIGKPDDRVRKFCLYGDITGEKEPDGFPVRRDWAQEYEGKSWIIYGHTPVKKPRIVKHTINIDTGCVFGGSLTALRYPEFTYESVPSSMPFDEGKFRLDDPQ